MDVDLADTVVERVGNEEVERRVNGDRLAGAGGGTGRQVDGRLGRWLAVPGEPTDTVAGDGGDEAVNIDPADAIVEGVGDEQTVFGVDNDTLGAVQRRRGGRPTVTREAEAPAASFIDSVT